MKVIKDCSSANFSKVHADSDKRPSLDCKLAKGLNNAVGKTEGVTIQWTDEAVDELARIAFEVNARTANIGARRLHTVLERLLDDLLYNAPDIGVQTIPITRAYVQERLGAVAADDDLARYVL